MKIIAQNKKAFHDYVVEDTIEAGLVLTGDEVKSLRAGRGNLAGAFVTSRGDELYMINAHISPYTHSFNKKGGEDDGRRSRKVLMKRKQIDKLIGEISRKGVTLVPLKLYFSKGLVKVSVGLCKHKKAHQRKEDQREKDINRETRRELKGKYDY